MPEAASRWTTSGSSSGAPRAAPEDAPDPFGARAEYALRLDGRTHTAADPRALRRLLGAPRGVDPAALHGYLCFSHPPEPRTLFAGIGRVATPAPWRERPAPTDEDSAVRALRALLSASVARMLGAERDVGVYLSGGLDSSLVAALLARAGARVHLFSLDFGAPWDVELEHAEAVAAHLGRPLHRVRARARDVLRALEPTAAALHQPFGDSVTVPLFLLGQAARGEVSTVFNGEGGDQLFGGWATKPMIAAEAYGGPGYSREAAYLATYHRFHGVEDQLLTPAARAAIGAVDAGAWLRPALDAPGLPTLLHRLRAANIRLKGAQNIAPRMTQLAAAHGLQARAPFMDRDLAEWTFTLPADFFLRGASEKHLLKRAAEGLLPPALIDRPKRGMGVPATEWLRGWISPLRWEAARRLSARRLRRDGWFRPEYVAALRRGDDDPGETRRRRGGEKLWALLMLHLWMDAQDPPLDWRIS
ncbi:MAG TPA: asparagine synthase C-terminal domain-containing protein [Longimicrobium sp.]|jgi:asparagine synthase (glutamine-hydrolysing)|uniref:asparagine synthetase B family protein n=1 Tax=Longimicrobium sp. TaxID=2029185 RepID=UPI002EDA1DEE